MKWVCHQLFRERNSVFPERCSCDFLVGFDVEAEFAEC